MCDGGNPCAGQEESAPQGARAGRLGHAGGRSVENWAGRDREQVDLGQLEIGETGALGAALGGAGAQSTTGSLAAKKVLTSFLG
jgi:hypothetical protein